MTVRIYIYEADINLFKVSAQAGQSVSDWNARLPLPLHRTRPRTYPGCRIVRVLDDNGIQAPWENRHLRGAVPRSGEEL